MDNPAPAYTNRKELYMKISYAIRAMNSPAEAQWIDDAREFIGPALFDGLLDPPRVEGTLTAEE